MSDSVSSAPYLCAFVGRVPKIGAFADDSDDRASAHGIQGFKNGSGVCRAAVADGASDSLFSGFWAGLLTRAFCETGGDSLLKRFPDLQATWRAKAASASLPWYAEAKRAGGAAAAICGVTFHPSEAADGSSGVWEAFAVGDSCVFQVRDAAILHAFPLTRADDFTGHPVLLSTRTNPQAETFAPYIYRHTGTWHVGDVFYLMTDALAAWFLREAEEGRAPHRYLSELDARREPNCFAALVHTMRDANRLRDDDTTLLRAEIRRGENCDLPPGA